MNPIVIIFLTIFMITSKTEGANIVCVSFVSTKSHKNVYEPLLFEMAKKGHEVTIITPIPSNKNVTNIKEVIIPGYGDIMEKFPNFFEVKEKNITLNPFTDAVKQFSEVCERAYSEKAVTDLLKEKFDLVLVNVLFNDCAYGLVRKFNAPTIGISSVSTPFWLSGALGSPSPPSFVPSGFVVTTERMDFYQRTLNLLLIGFVSAAQHFFYFPTMEEIYRRHLDDPALPSAMEIFRDNVSLILSNSHFSLNSLRPLMPQIVEVGGMHCRPAKALPKDLDNFLKDTDREGFIYFSMGSTLQAHKMSEKYRKIFLNAFAKLPMKVLWKWEKEMPDLPTNVKIMKWLPQQDILGHPNIKMFITHGGLLSTEEAVYHGVPLVGIPLFGDQDMNMMKSESMGFAKSLDFSTLSEENLLAAINEIIGDSKYKEKVQHLSKIFRDQPETPMERAVFWTEYVLRHKGAPHLRSPAADLNFFQYYSIDVIAFLAALLYLIVYLPLKIVLIFCTKCFGFKKSKGVNEKKKKS